MKVRIDPDKCTGHGVCEGVAEDIFEVRDDGLAYVLQDPPEDRRADVDQAIKECPTLAISVED